MWIYRISFPLYIPHIIASDQETHVTRNEEQHWVQTYGIHWSYHVHHHPEATGFIEW